MKKYFKEITIPSSYDFYAKDGEGPLRYLTNFSAYEMTNGRKKVKIEDIETVQNLTFEGVLIPSKENTPKAEVILSRTLNYTYDFGSTDKSLYGIWILTENGIYYKLMDPDPSYVDFYKDFKEKSDIWMDLFVLLLDGEDEQSILEKLSSKYPNYLNVFAENYNFFITLIRNADTDNGTNFFRSEFVSKYFRNPKQKLKESNKTKKTLPVVAAPKKQLSEIQPTKVRKSEINERTYFDECKQCKRQQLLTFFVCSNCQSRFCYICLTPNEEVLEYTNGWICNDCIRKKN